MLSNKKYFLLLPALVLSLPKKVISLLLKYFSEKPSSGTVCSWSTPAICLLPCIFNHKFCADYIKKINKWLLKLETLKLIMWDARKILALLIEQSSLLLKQESFASTWSKTYGSQCKAGDTFQQIHFKELSTDWSAIIWQLQLLKGREKLQMLWVSSLNGEFWRV